MKYYLNTNIRFRKERDYVLVCDLSVMENYNFPLDYYNDFIDLLNGKEYPEKNDFIDDLTTLSLISTKPNSTVDCKIDVFAKLKYGETEFFN